MPTRLTLFTIGKWYSPTTPKRRGGRPGSRQATITAPPQPPSPRTTPGGTHDRIEARALDRPGHPRPARPYRRDHRCQHRHRLRDGQGTRPARAAVVLAVRDTDKGKRAAEEIALAAPTASVRVQRLDLSSLASVRDAAGELRDAYARIDTLINNAGVMYTPAGDDRERLRAAVRHQPPGPLRPDRAPAGQAPRLARLARRHGQQRGTPHGRPRRSRRPRLAQAPVRPDRRLRTLEAGQPAVHLRTRPQTARRRAAGRRRPSRGADTTGSRSAMAHSSAVTRAAFAAIRPLLLQSPRGAHCPCCAPRPTRGAGWRVLRPSRIPAEQGAPQGGPLQPAVVRHVAATPAVGAVAGHDRCRVSRVAPRERRGETNRRPPCAARGPAATVTSEGRAEDACAHFPCRSAGNRHLQVRSNSPSRAPDTNAPHSAGVKIKEGLSGRPLLRIAMNPSTKAIWTSPGHGCSSANRRH